MCLVVIRQTIVSTLSTQAYGKLVVDVIFHTYQNFVSAMFQRILTTEDVEVKIGE